MAELTSSSPFVEGFRLYTLSFATTTNSGDSEFTEDPDNSNPILTPIGGSQPVELVATLRTTADPRVLMLVGADGIKVALKGRCVDPMEVPPGIIAGMECTLDIDGVQGVFKVGPSWHSSVIAVEEALGQTIIGTWTSVNTP